MPYAARDISDFWRRWHMTLSLWLKDYLYIPLGGNRKGEWGTYRNLAITMLLGGLWHGASWNFVAWGALHGAALGIHRFHVRRRGNSAGLPDWLAWSLTLFFVTLAWLPFRASTFGQTTLCLSKMFGLATDPGVEFLPFWLPVCLLLVVLGHGIGLNLERQNPSWGTWLLNALGLTQVQHPLSGRLIVLTRPTFCGGFAVTLFLLTIFLFAATNTNPFIYFQF